MFLPFTPLVSFTNLPSSLFPSQPSEKNSKTRQEVQDVRNVPNEKRTPIEISACVNETEDAATRVNRTIDTLRTDQNKALEFKNSLISLKEKIDSVTNQPDKGFLRYSETKDLYLSNHFKILETVGLRDAGAAKFEKKFDGLDLEFGKKTSKESIISKIDKKLDDQDKYISSLGDMIKYQEVKLSAEQPTTNDADSNTPDEIKSDQHEDMDDVLSAWPQKNPKYPIAHSFIADHLNGKNPNLNDEIDFFESILNIPENPGKQYSQSNFDTTDNPTAQIVSQQSIDSIDQTSTEKKDNKSGAFRPPVPPRTRQYKESTSAPDNNTPTNPARPVLVKATEKESEKLFNSEQQTPNDRGVLPSSQVKRSESETGTSSTPTPIPAPRKTNFKPLNRTESNPETSTTGTTGTTKNTFKDIRAFWEAQDKPDSV